MNPNTIEKQIAECKRRLNNLDIDAASRNLEEKELARLEKEWDEFEMRHEGFEEQGHSNSAVGDAYNMN